VGSVSETPHALTVLVRFVDVESSDILVATDVYGEDLSPPDVGELMTGLAAKVRQSFPLVRGLVLHAERNKKRMKLLVFRCAGSEGGTSASRGKDCEADTDVLDEVAIEAVFDDRAQGILRRSKTAVQEADSVITK
jgi:hypothetical protein